MSGSVRIERLQQLIKERVAEAVLFEIKDPRMGFVTITKVKLARDLTVATVFYSVLGHEGEKKRTQEALEASRGHFQREIGKVMQTRLTPKLEFRFDQSIEGMIRIHKILDDVGEEAKKRATATGAAEAGAPSSEEADVADEDEDEDADEDADDDDDEADVDDEAADDAPDEGEGDEDASEKS